MSAAVHGPVHGRPAPVQEFDASPHAQGLVRDAALLLGASAAQAREAARTGRFELQQLTIAVAADPGEQALLLSVDLGADYLAQADRAHAALAANIQLFVGAGVAFALGLAGPVLLRRWSLADAGSLADAVRQLGAFAQAFGVPCSATAQAPSLSPLPADSVAIRQV
ncbi:hypothetical protein [Acidovorax sp. PRC11]|nr:hypothetical protein [Acidovorax sp. PRC11]MDT0139354.1 hypothetical protein [Acidovorax sp. PRC11]